MAEILGKEQLADSDNSLFSDHVEGHSTKGGCAKPEGETPKGFQEKENPARLGKKEKDRMSRKDAISRANLTEKKIKEVFKFPCCDGCCLSELGRSEIRKHRTYYYGLTWSEKNVLLRGF